MQKSFTIAELCSLTLRSNVYDTMELEEAHVIVSQFPFLLLVFVLHRLMAMKQLVPYKNC
jgi:hypothetical protein